MAINIRDEMLLSTQFDKIRPKTKQKSEIRSSNRFVRAKLTSGIVEQNKSKVLVGGQDIVDPLVTMPFKGSFKHKSQK